MYTITALKAAFTAGTYTPTAAIADSLRVIEKQNPALNVFLDVYSDAHEAAAVATAQYAKGGDLPPLLDLVHHAEHRQAAGGDHVHEPRHEQPRSI